MKTKPEKSKLVPRAFEGLCCFDEEGIKINFKESVLGIDIDYMLKMDKRVSETCQNASKQLTW